MNYYLILDWSFMVVHSALILFNLTGWLFRKTRKYNLILLLLTGASWFILGIWKGIGYCPLTDWHYQVLRHLGVENLPVSYIAYFMERMVHWRFTDQVIDTITVTAFLVALIFSIRLNIRDFREIRRVR